MPTKLIRKLAGKKTRLNSMIGELLAALDEPVGILDLDGNLVLGSLPEAASTTYPPAPINYKRQPVGWVASANNPGLQEQIASILAYMVDQEAEKKALAGEVLDKYRELHLLYQLSDRLIASPQVNEIASMALKEAYSMIRVAGGLGILMNGNEGEIETIASCGDPVVLKPNLAASGGIIERVLRTGIGEMLNQVQASDYFEGREGAQVSILCSPLKADRVVFGAFILISGPEKQFSSGDLKLLDAIAMQTAPAIQIARLHQVEIEKTRLERELQLARQVQTDLLPRKMPNLQGWEISAYWQPARMVSGDFYDFIHFPDGKLGLVIADVTDKGMPAALVMANTRSMLRAVALNTNSRGQRSPGKILVKLNELLCKEIPQNMFVTCLLVILDPHSGEFRFANAGHNLPYLRMQAEVLELRATGMPLGIFPNQIYEESEARLDFGESLLMYSDGLPEAHNPQGEMFGYPRLRQSLSYQANGAEKHGDDLFQFLMEQLEEFSGTRVNLEDDVTMVTVQRLPEMF